MFVGHTEDVYAVAFSPDGALVASAGKDRGIRVWDTRTKRQTMTLRGHHDAVQALAFLPGGRLASAGKEGTVHIWRMEPSEYRTVPCLFGVRDLAFMPDGRHLVWSQPSDYRNGKSEAWPVRVTDLAGRQRDQRLPVRCETFSLSRDGLRLAALVGEDVEVWSFPDRKKLFTVAKATVPLAFSPDGKYLAVTPINKTRGGFWQSSVVRVIDAGTGKTVHTLPGHSLAVEGLAFHPTGSELAVSDKDSVVSVWGLADGKLLRRLDKQRLYTGNLPLISPAYSPDGRLLATGYPINRKTVRILDSATGQPKVLIEGHTGEVIAVAFTPDGRRLATASEDRTIKIWDVASGQELLSFKDLSQVAVGLVFSPDGHRLAAAIGRSYGNILIWDADRGKSGTSDDRLPQANTQPPKMR
jgi:WD40 repeat protein